MVELSGWKIFGEKLSFQRDESGSGGGFKSGQKQNQNGRSAFARAEQGGQFAMPSKHARQRQCRLWMGLFVPLSHQA